MFSVSEVRNWIRQLDKEEISFSKFVELFNEKVFNARHPSPGKGEKDLESRVADYLCTYRHDDTMTDHRIANHILKMVCEPPSPKQEGMRWRKVIEDAVIAGQNNIDAEGNYIGHGVPASVDYIMQLHNLDESSPSSPGMREALEGVIKSWDERMNGEVEQLKHSEEGGFDYWSPVASLVDSKAIAAARKALTQSPAEVEREAGVRMFEAFDSVNKRVTDRTVYMDQEGDLYEDQDPHGVDMSGTRRIKSTIRYTLYQQSKTK
jgi:hypothetical protein